MENASLLRQAQTLSFHPSLIFMELLPFWIEFAFRSIEIGMWFARYCRPAVIPLIWESSDFCWKSPNLWGLPGGGHAKS